MSRIPWFAVLALSCAAAAHATDAAAPSRFESRNPHRAAPIWIAAEEAIGSDGTLRPGAVAPAEAMELERVLQQHERSAASPDDCHVTFASKLDDGPGNEVVQSWAHLREHAERGVVISGVVVSSRVGLYAGLPSTLLTVEPSKSNRELPYQVFLVYPRGLVRIGGKGVCTNDPGYAGLPQSGDRILFVASEPVDSEGTLFRPSAPLLFYERAGKLVPSPAALRWQLVRFRSLAEFERELIHSPLRPRRRWLARTDHLARERRRISLDGPERQSQARRWRGALRRRDHSAEW